MVQAQSNEADDWETVAEGMTTPSAAKAAAFKASSADTPAPGGDGKKCVLLLQGSLLSGQWLCKKLSSETWCWCALSCRKDVPVKVLVHFNGVGRGTCPES